MKSQEDERQRAVQLGTEFGLGSQATAVVEDIGRQMTAQEQFVREIDCWSLVRTAAEGASSGIEVPDYVPAELRHGARSSIIALAIRRVWASSRIIYALHPQMLAELADSSSEQLPGPIFSYLPHTNPLVIFPEPIPTTTPDGARGQILGCSMHDAASRTTTRPGTSQPDGWPPASLTAPLAAPGRRSSSYQTNRTERYGMSESDSRTDDGLLVLATPENHYLATSGERVWRRVDTEMLRKNLDDLVSKVTQSFMPSAGQERGPFEVSSVAVAVTIGAKGEVGILGTGVEAKAEASFTLTLTRTKKG